MACAYNNLLLAIAHFSHEVQMEISVICRSYGSVTSALSAYAKRKSLQQTHFANLRALLTGFLSVQTDVPSFSISKWYLFTDQFTVRRRFLRRFFICGKFSCFMSRYCALVILPSVHFPSFVANTGLLIRRIVSVHRRNIKF